jgi:hypothetical protein
MKVIVLSLVIVSVLITSICGFAWGTSANLYENTLEAHALSTKLSTLQVPFIENKGQTHVDVRYYANTFSGTLFVTNRGELVYALCAGTDSNPDGIIFKETLLGGSPPNVRGEQSSSSTVNYFKGSDPNKWHSAVPTFNKVSLGEIYEGIELSLHAKRHNIEKVFRVRRGAQPSLIRLQFEGTKSLYVNQSGELVLTTSTGDLAFTKPIAYQTINGKKQNIEVAYEVSGISYGFHLGPYDTNHELIIDPLMSTYIGGGRRESGQAIATNIILGERYIYVAGQTTSNDFPGYGMFQPSPGYNQDAFVALINMDLTEAQYTYLGGNGEDTIYDMAIRQPDGQVFVVGWTDGDFPVTNRYSRGGDRDAFVARLSWDLGILEKSRYLGGSGRDYALGIDLYNPGNPVEDVVYVAGTTISTDFPGTATGADPTHGGAPLSDGFAARFNIDLVLQRSTYLGGHSSDSGGDIAVHPVEPHDVYVVGQTAYDHQQPPYGSTGCFPWTDGGALPFAGSHDAFVVRLNPDLTANPPPQATYYGGPGLDFGLAVTVHPSTSDVYVAGGRTNDTSTGQGAFAAYFERDLTVYDGDTVLYGDYIERATDIEIVPGVGIYISGYTSGELDGTTGAILPTFRGGSRDVFVARFHNNLDLDMATYVGSTGQDESFGHGLAVAEDPSTAEEDWHVFVTGEIFSHGLIGVTDATAFQSRIDGTSDVLIARMNADLRPDPIPDIEVQPRWLDFGNVRLNTSSLPLTATLENIGGSNLTISSVTIVGAGANDYTINHAAGDTPCGDGMPFDIAASSGCSVTITFTPTVDNQLRTADLVIQVANDPDEPLVRIPLSGYSGPDIEFPDTVQFPDTEIDYTESRAFMIRNTGYSDLDVSSIQLIGIDVPDHDFTLRFGGNANDCPDPSITPLTLEPNRYCYLHVDFTPTVDTAPASQEAKVFIFSNDLDEDPAIVTLLGTGVTDLDANIWSHDLEFGDVAIGNAKALPWLITNTGSEPLTVDGLALSEPAHFLYDQDGGAIPCGAFPFTLQAVSSCTMMVTFRPQTVGPINETLTIYSNDTDEDELVINLTGVGGLDSDNDGVPDSQESGDANGDTIPDAQQGYVASVPTPDDQHVIVIESDDPDATLVAVRPENPPEESLPWPLDRFELPFGLFHFKVILPEGADTANITITLPEGETVDTYIKYGTEVGLWDPHYYDFGNPDDYPGNVEIAGNVITLHLVDNGAGDHDLIWGQITDPGAPARWIRGDFNTSGSVDLLDAVVCLRILSGIETPTIIKLESDPNGDDAVGLSDLVFILQKIARLR